MDVERESADILRLIMSISNDSAFLFGLFLP